MVRAGESGNYHPCIHECERMCVGVGEMARAQWGQQNQDNSISFNIGNIISIRWLKTGVVYGLFILFMNMILKWFRNQGLFFYWKRTNERTLQTLLVNKRALLKSNSKKSKATYIFCFGLAECEIVSTKSCCILSLN